MGIFSKVGKIEPEHWNFGSVLELIFNQDGANEDFKVMQTVKKRLVRDLGMKFNERPFWRSAHLNGWATEGHVDNGETFI